MNAYELADKLDKIYDQGLETNTWDDSVKDSANMLRQLAKEKAKLEKSISHLNQFNIELQQLKQQLEKTDILKPL